MAAPVLSSLTRVRVSTTEGGTYTGVGYTRSMEIVRGSEGDTTIRYFGGDSSVPGDKTLEGTIPCWFDDADTNGQEVLKTAYTNATAVWLQFCPRGTTAGNKAVQFEAYITEIRIASDVEGDAAELTFSYRGTPSSLTTPTLS